MRTIRITVPGKEGGMDVEFFNDCGALRRVYRNIFKTSINRMDRLVHRRHRHTDVNLSAVTEQVRIYVHFPGKPKGGFDA